MYVTRFPSNECAKVIIQSRIKEVIYLKEGPRDLDAYRAARIMFKMAGIKTRRHVPTQAAAVVDFGPLAQDESGDDKEAAAEKARQDAAKAEDEREAHKDLLVEEAGYDPSQPPLVPKREGYLTWETYFMAVAFLSAMRSKDPSTQVGACIVDSRKRIVGIGYNGFPRGCSDECLPWARGGVPDLHKKYPYVVHAEVNAIINKCSADVRGATIYVALFPCNDCTKVIIQSGIREVVYLNDQYHDTDACRASRIMFRMAGVRLRRYRPETRTVQINLQV